jgi:hypothetical protein
MKKKTAGKTEKKIMNDGVHAVYSKLVSAGNKKYYFDVRKAKTGNLYLTIKEVTIADTSDFSESRRILVFDKGIKDFAESMNECAKHFGTVTNKEV